MWLRSSTNWKAHASGSRSRRAPTAERNPNSPHAEIGDLADILDHSTAASLRRSSLCLGSENSPPGRERNGRAREPVVASLTSDYQVSFSGSFLRFEGKSFYMAEAK